MIKACCILACQVFPLPGLLVCGPGSCLSSLGSETTLLAYLQGLQPPGTAAQGLVTQLLWVRHSGQAWQQWQSG